MRGKRRTYSAPASIQQGERASSDPPEDPATTQESHTSSPLSVRVLAVVVCVVGVQRVLLPAGSSELMGR